MRTKYIDERFPPYFKFGEHLNGQVDLATPSNDTVATTSPQHADTLIADRQALIDMVDLLANALDMVNPAMLKDIWYGETRSRVDTLASLIKFLPNAQINVMSAKAIQNDRYGYETLYQTYCTNRTMTSEQYFKKVLIMAGIADEEVTDATGVSNGTT